MPYAPPLVKPPLPPLRPPVAPPFRPPGPNRLPPTQPAPIYQPPDLLPPTDIDLKGVICIYSNAPVWELKKIRYRYPGEAWQEITGDRYTLENIVSPPAYFSNWLIYDVVLSIQALAGPSPGIYNIFFPDTSVQGTLLEVKSPFPIGTITGGNLYWSYSFRIIEFIGVLTVQSIHPGHFDLSQSAYNKILVFDYKIKDLNTNQYPPLEQCVFKVFGVFNQEILSITRDVCPEVIVVPERCYFRPENERLVGRWIVGFWDPPLRIEYEGHCASVWRDYGLFSLLIFKECSDNPSCPPPRIRFDKKCEEKCEQCPPGTAIKVLLGGNIACVDSVGCVKKMIKYKPGCNSYDCICS